MQPMWVWPTVTGVVAFVVGELAARIRLPSDHWLRDLVWPGDTSAASALVQTVATSAVTVTTLTFSVTVVALQLASQQFSPRLLREFTRDPITRVVLSVLVATFVCSLTGLRHFRTDEPPPVLSVLLAFLLGLLALASVLAFITHMIRTLRVDSMMRAVHDDTSRAIETFYPSYDDDSRTAGEGILPQVAGIPVEARKSGFVRLVNVDGLVAAAAAAHGVVRVEVRPGDHVVRGTPVATVWATDEEDLAEAVHGCVDLGFERTFEQDAAFGFRQLEDIAVKALSPGINDPVTAAHAVGHLSDLLVRLLGCRLGASEHRDDDGAVRAVVPDRDLRYYLELACGQLRRYASGEPTVLVALLRMLRDMAAAARDDRQREEIAREAALVRETASSDLLHHDLAPVQDMERRVRLALAGDVAAAFGDRSGETRSI